jgi:hypothetical protein
VVTLCGNTGKSGKIPADYAELRRIERFFEDFPGAAVARRVA